MADQGAGAEGVTVVALQQVGPLAPFDPVVAGIAEHRVQAGAGVNEVVAKACEGFSIAHAAINDICAVTAEEQIQAAGVGDYIVAIPCLDVVVSEGIAENVVAGTTKEEVIAGSTFDGVVPAITVDGVVAFTRGESVIRSRAPHYRVLNAAIADGAVRQAGEKGGFVPWGEGVIQNGARGAHPARFEVEGRRGKHISRQVGRRGVARDDIAEGLFLQLGEYIQACCTGEVIEAVVVLQLQHLCAEHIGKAGAQHAAEGLQFLRQTTEPEVHIFQATEGTTCVDPGRIEEVLGIQVSGGGSADQGCRSGPTGRVCRGGLDRCVGAVGGDEIGERFQVLDVLSEIVPTDVGRESRVARVVEKQTASPVETWCASVAASSHVERAQVEGQANQVVAQGFGEEFVNLVSYLLHHARADRTHSGFGVHPALLESHRVEEGVDQAHGHGDPRAGIDPIHRVGELGVAKAVDDVGEKRHDRRIHSVVISAEDFDRWQQFAGEFLKHEMLILHLVGEFACLEQALTIPLQCSNGGRGGGEGSHRREQPLVEEGQIGTGEHHLLHVVH